MTQPLVYVVRRDCVKSRCMDLCRRSQAKRFQFKRVTNHVKGHTPLRCFGPSVFCDKVLSCSVAAISGPSSNRFWKNNLREPREIIEATVSVLSAVFRDICVSKLDFIDQILIQEMY